MGITLKSERPRRRIPSAFATILRRLVLSTPGILGAAFADEEGETVDFYGRIDSFEIKVAAAHMGILGSQLKQIKSISADDHLCEIRLCAENYHIITRTMGIGYQVTVLLEPAVALPKFYPALERAIAELRIESGGFLG